MALKEIRQLLESNSGDIKYAKKKSLDIITDIQDKIGSAKAIAAGLEGYVESLELFYNENEDSKSADDTKDILKQINKLKIQLDLVRTTSGITGQIIKNIKKLKA